MDGVAVLVLLLLVACASLPSAAGQDLAALSACDSDMQIVMCGQVSFTDVEERRLCCETYKPVPAEQIVVATEAVKAAAEAVPSLTVQGELSVMSLSVANYSFMPAVRGDLARAPLFARKLDYYQGNCLQQAQVAVPTFPSVKGVTGYKVNTYNVPQLPSNTIKAVKDAAKARWPPQLMAAYNRFARTSSTSGFIHPAGYAGPAELALLQYRLGTAAKIQRGAQSQVPISAERSVVPQQSVVTETALYSMISGANVVPKVYSGPWWPPVDCSPTAYQGPYPMPKVRSRRKATPAPVWHVTLHIPC
eukprot:GHUV01019315.1.p1 GENE.GHUV01019315.1~~GHUV01019315.1.p1  ORF type:complete len:305 (-),score=41.87 GHUV01019315.1:843-1757(-)